MKEQNSQICVTVAVSANGEGVYCSCWEIHTQALTKEQYSPYKALLDTQLAFLPEGYFLRRIEAVYVLAIVEAVTINLLFSTSFTSKVYEYRGKLACHELEQEIETLEKRVKKHLSPVLANK